MAADMAWCIWREEGGNMNCEKAAEFVSVLCDGERIPREVAEHFGTCAECKARLNEYLQMSAELKRMAIIAAPQHVRDVSWGPQETTKSSWWQMWRESMRIPRYAFGLMLVVILSLGAGIVIARANNSERWFQFEVRARDGRTALTGVMSAEPKEPVSPSPVIAHEPEGTLAFIVRVLGGSGGSERLGVRAIWLPQNADQSGIKEKLLGTPEREFWVIPGQKLSIPVKDYGEIEITGQLLDKLPDDQNPSEMRLYPKEGQFQVIAPQVLLVDGHVLTNSGGSGLGLATKDYFFAYYSPHDGWYVFAFNAFPGATEGKINANQVEFTLDGRTYTLVAAAPIVDASVTKIWVQHHAGNRLMDDQHVHPDQDSHSSMMFGGLKHMLEHITKE
jgi:hypothetical protein